MKFRLVIDIDAHDREEADGLRGGIVGAIEDNAESGEFAAEAIAGELQPCEPDAPPCEHKTFYWINRKNLNWRCTDRCGFQFFGETVTEVRKRDREAAR